MLLVVIFSFVDDFLIAFGHHSSPFHGLSPGFLHPILYSQPSPLQSDSRHFHLFNHSVLAARAAALSGHFLPIGIFLPYALSQHFWHNLLLSRLPWEPAVIPSNLQGFILILKTQTRPICLFDSQ